MTVVRDTALQNDADRLRREVRSMAAKNDIEGLARLSPDLLQLRRHEAAERVEVRSARLLDEGRGASDREDTLSKADLAEMQALDAALLMVEHRSAQEQHSERMLNAIADATGRGRRVETRSGHTPLVVSEDHLRSHADAIRRGSTYGAEEDLGEIYTRAAVTVATDMGSPGDWAAGNIRSPVTLREFAGIPNAKLTGMTAQMPSVTLPAGAAGVAETANHGEYDAVDVVNLTAARYGRWTQVTAAADAFDELTVINRAHSVGIARDLNLLDAAAIITAAGAVTAFSATLLDQNVRAAILKVAAAALVEPEDVVIFGTSAALAVINGYAPASGGDRGSVTTRVFGARVYVHEPTTAGNVYAFAPQGFQVFSDRLRSASTIDPKNGGNTFGQWMHSTGPGVAIVGAAAGVDVVTP